MAIRLRADELRETELARYRKVVNKVGRGEEGGVVGGEQPLRAAFSSPLRTSTRRYLVPQLYLSSPD